MKGAYKGSYLDTKYAPKQLAARRGYGRRSTERRLRPMLTIFQGLTLSDLRRPFPEPY